MAADLGQNIFLVIEFDDLAAGRGAEAVTVGNHQGAAAFNELGEVVVVDFGADDRYTGTVRILPVGLSGLDLFQSLTQVRQNLALGTYIGHKVQHMELITRNNRILSLAELANFGDDFADFVMLFHRFAQCFIRSVYAEDFTETVKHANAHLPAVAFDGVIGDFEGHVTVGHKEIRVVVDLENFKVLHGAVHHRTSINANQRVQELIAALNGTLQQSAGKLTGVVGHVVGRDVNGTCVGCAEPG